MSIGADVVAMLEQFAAATPLPRVRALYLPKKPTPGGLRGEFCALQLDDGSLGLSYVLLGDTWAGMANARGRLDPAGRGALEVARACAAADPGARALGFAAASALTRCLFDRAGFAPGHSRDSIGHLDPQPGEQVGMIGYFPSLVAQVQARGAALRVIELREELVGERDGVTVTTDASQLGRCEKVLSTGTLLINDTLDRMLDLARGARRFALIGPSVGCPPDPLFARGVSFLGGSWITDARGYVDALVRGESTAPFARKSALMPDTYPGWEELLRRSSH